MIASLMMYQRPQLARAHDRFWTLIRAALKERGIDSPKTLSQEAEEFAVWRDPHLVLSQTCGMPYRTWLHNDVALVGTPDYGLAGCPPGYYRSALVVRADDPRDTLSLYRDAVFAFNQTFSQSGYAAAYWHVRPHGFWFQNRLQTEQHLASARAVAGARADIASLDTQSWRLMERYEPFAKDLRVLEWTTPTPGLPLITALKDQGPVIFDAVQQAIAALEETDKTLLDLKGIVLIDKDNYLAVRNPPQPSG